jgi:hypothetical protein
MVFMFSTIYTLAFYWYQAENTSMNAEGLDEYDGELRKPLEKDKSFITTVVTSLLDMLIEALSWFSPFALVKGLLIILVPPPIYEPLNLLILRPLGWIGTWITTEWVINKIRGGSET